MAAPVSMLSVAHFRAGEYVPTADQRVLVQGASWAMFEAVLATRGESAIPRLAYLDGVLELMSPSKDHERIGFFLGQLVVQYALARGIDLSGYGAWTLRETTETSGLEPDECFIIGADQSKDRPDLAIEVIWTSGGLGKLEIYRRLGVTEVWRWKDNRLEVHVLRDGHYVAQEHSDCFPQLDLSFICTLLEQPTVTQAVRALLDHLRDG